MQGLEQSQNLLEGEIASVNSSLDKCLNTIDSVNTRLEEGESQKAVLHVKPEAEKPSMSQEDFKALLENLLKGTLEGLGDKISQNILLKLKDLKGLTGETREAKMQELKEAADAELIDLSKLFYEKIETNIEEIGLEEKETKGIDKNLQKLRKIKENKKS